MALDLTQEQKEQGKKNFATTTGELTRRGFMKSMAAAGAVLPVSAAVYYGYSSWKGNKPLKAALIGGGDEGGVLLGEHNPEFIEFIACCDIRPFNKDRIIDGDPKVPLRKGFKKIYGPEYAKKIRENHFYSDFEEMLKKEPDLEAVVIALPLHLHAPVAIACMKYGQQRGKPIHVLCEKLMARTITECKEMIKVAKETGSILSIGHQRHYSMLYAHALEVVNAGVLGDLKHIRALWHRNNSWPYSEDKNGPTLATGVKQPDLRDGWYQPVYEMDYAALKDPATLKKYGYDSVEQLIRWRLYNRTGGGLMAELGSHQLDACSIFLGKVKPLAVMGVGGKFFYGPGRNDRESGDGVFVTFEFPGKNHPQGAGKGSDPSDIVVMTYSSFNTNGFEKYGECLMGSRGTMIVESEQDVYLYKEAQPGKKDESDAKKTNVSVTSASGGKPALEAASTWGGPAGAVVKADGTGAPVSRGYREEMEHFAYCVRKWDPKLGYQQTEGKYVQELPRCHGEVAMADAICALTANMAMNRRTRIEFDPLWFQADKGDVPETKHGDPQSGLA